MQRGQGWSRSEKGHHNQEWEAEFAEAQQPANSFILYIHKGSCCQLTHYTETLSPHCPPSQSLLLVQKPPEIEQVPLLKMPH